MMRRCMATIAGVVAAGLMPVAAANAADRPVKMPVKAPVQAAPVSWTGWYAGASIGYLSGKVVNGTPAYAASENIAPKGVIGTVLGGYDYQLPNNIVVGVRLAAPIISLSDSTPSGLGVTFEGQIKWAVIAAGRVGYAINDFLPYFIGGAVWGRGEGTVIGVGSAEASHTGWLLGGGVEYRFAPNWSVDVNYTHTSMSKETYDFTPYGGLAVSEGFRTDTVSLGVNYRF